MHDLPYHWYIYISFVLLSIHFMMHDLPYYWYMYISFWLLSVHFIDAWPTISLIYVALSAFNWCMTCPTKDMYISILCCSLSISLIHLLSYHWYTYTHKRPILCPFSLSYISVCHALVLHLLTVYMFILFLPNLDMCPWLPVSWIHLSILVIL